MGDRYIGVKALRTPHSQAYHGSVYLIVTFAARTAG